MDYFLANAVSTLFTELGEAHLEADTLDGQTLGMRCFTRAPVLTSDSTVLPGVLSVEELTNLPGWVPMVNQPSFTDNGTPEVPYYALTTDGDYDYYQIKVVSTTDTAAVETGIGWAWDYVGAPAPYNQELLHTVAFFIEGTVDDILNPLILLSSSNLGNSAVHTDAMVSTSNELSPYGPGNAYLFRWQTTTHQQEIGSLTFRPALPEWEPSHASHLWIAPERMNLIANPRFRTTHEVGGG